MPWVLADLLFGGLSWQAKLIRWSWYEHMQVLGNDPAKSVYHHYPSSSRSRLMRGDRAWFRANVNSSTDRTRLFKQVLDSIPN